MQTQCISDQLDFEAFDGRRVVAGFDGGLEKTSPYVCALVDDPLAQAELEQLCVNFRPEAGSVVRRASGRPALP